MTMKRRRNGDGGREDYGDSKSLVDWPKRGVPTASETSMATRLAPPPHSSSSSYSHSDRVSHSGVADNHISATASASPLSWADRRKLRRRLYGDLHTIKGLIARLEARKRVLSTKDLTYGKGSGSGTDSARLLSYRQEAGSGVLVRDGGNAFLSKVRVDAVDAFTKEWSAAGARMALAGVGSDSRGRATKNEEDQMVRKHAGSQIHQPTHSDTIKKAAETKGFVSDGDDSMRADTKGHYEHQAVKRGGISRPASASNIRNDCAKLLDDLSRDRNAWAFEKPVLVIWPHLYDYTSRIKSPMDLGTVKMKLLKGEYSDPWKFAADVHLTFTNALIYNQKGSAFYNSAKHMNLWFGAKFGVLEAMLAKMPNAPMARHEDHAPETRTVARPISGVLVQNRVATQNNESDPIKEKLLVDHKNAGVEPRQAHKIPKSKKSMEKPPSSRLGRSTCAFAYGGVRPLTAKEKEKLPLLIESLPADRAKKVIEILQQRNPGLLDGANGEVELDLEKFDEATMFELFRLAMNWEKSKKKALGRAQPSKDPNEPVQNIAGTTVSGKGHPRPPSEAPGQPTNRKDDDVGAGKASYSGNILAQPSDRKDEDGGVKKASSGKPEVIGSPMSEVSISVSESSTSDSSSSGSSTSSGSASDAESEKSSLHT